MTASPLIGDDARGKASAEDAFDTVLGTTGITGVVDSIFVLHRKQGEEDARLMGTGRDLEEELDKALHFNGRLWELKGVYEDDANQVELAGEFLKNVLAEGPMKANDVKQKAGMRGFTPEGALRTAREDLCKTYQKGRVWWWELK
jgi:hypothetical protein